MSILLLLSHVGKKITLELNNGHVLTGKLHSCTRNGMFMDELGEMFFIRQEEVKNIDLG